MISSLAYNGYTWDQDYATIEAMEGQDFAKISSDFVPFSQKPGILTTSWKEEERLIAIKGRIRNDTSALYLAERQELRFALRPTLLEGHTATFTLVTGDTRTLRYVVPITPLMPFADNGPSLVWNEYSLVLRAAFPYFEGTEVDGTQSITTIDGGVQVAAPVAAPLGFGGTQAGSYTNAGDAPAFPVFTITGPGTTFYIRNLTTGLNCSIAETLAAGETITIDTYNRDVRKNGTEDILSSFDGDFITLVGGSAGKENRISFTADSGTDANTQLRTVYKSAYAGI